MHHPLSSCRHESAGPMVSNLPQQAASVLEKVPVVRVNGNVVHDAGHNVSACQQICLTMIVQTYCNKDLHDTAVGNRALLGALHSSEMWGMLQQVLQDVKTIHFYHCAGRASDDDVKDVY